MAIRQVEATMPIEMPAIAPAPSASVILEVMLVAVCWVGGGLVGVIMTVLV